MFDKVDKSSPVPIYYQIQEAIEKKINNGTLRPMEKIPSEDDLAVFFNVSRMTVRKAIDELVGEGLLLRKHGAGTFVSKTNFMHKSDLSKLTSSTDDMYDSGLDIETDVLEKEVINASQEVGVKLNIPEGTEIVKYVRLRFLKKAPFYLETSYWHFPGCEQLLYEDLRYSVFALVEQRFGIAPYEATASIEAIGVDRFVGNILRINQGAPALKINQITFDEREPIHYATIISRSDKYKYHIHRRR